MTNHLILLEENDDTEDDDDENSEIYYTSDEDYDNSFFPMETVIGSYNIEENIFP
jgi:hypothetical protein